MTLRLEEAMLPHAGRVWMIRVSHGTQSNVTQVKSRARLLSWQKPFVWLYLG